MCGPNYVKNTLFLVFNFTSTGNDTYNLRIHYLFVANYYFMSEASVFWKLNIIFGTHSRALASRTTTTTIIVMFWSKWKELCVQKNDYDIYLKYILCLLRVVISFKASDVRVFWKQKRRFGNNFAEISNTHSQVSHVLASRKKTMSVLASSYPRFNKLFICFQWS